MKIALTGGIACGKSLFAKFLRELGIQVLDADDVVHRDVMFYQFLTDEFATVAFFGFRLTAHHSHFQSLLGSYQQSGKTFLEERFFAHFGVVDMSIGIAGGVARQPTDAVAHIDVDEAPLLQQRSQRLLVERGVPF